MFDQNQAFCGTSYQSSIIGGLQGNNPYQTQISQQMVQSGYQLQVNGVPWNKNKPIGADIPLSDGFKEYQAAKRAQLTGQATPTVTANKPNVAERRHSMFEEFRAYVKEYRNVLFTLVIVLVVDYLFLGGSLRQRVQSALSGLIDKAEGTLGVGHAAPRAS